MKTLNILILLFVLVLGMAVFLQIWNKSHQTPQEREYKEEALDRDKVIIEEQEELTENPNALYY
jgi:hypothetical protein